MCGDGGAARDARRTEQRLVREQKEREERIKLGQSNIDSAFAQFNDGYFDEYAQSVADYQRPMLNDQYGDAFGKITAALAGRGMLESSVGARNTARLAGERDRQLVEIDNRGRDLANELRGRVESTRGDLYALNTASADPDSASTQAIGQATSLVAPAAVSPIENAFQSFLTPLYLYQSARQNSPGRPYQSSAPVAANGGSGRVVR